MRTWVQLANTIGLVCQARRTEQCPCSTGCLVIRVHPREGATSTGSSLVNRCLGSKRKPSAFGGITSHACTCQAERQPRKAPPRVNGLQAWVSMGDSRLLRPTRATQATELQRPVSTATDVEQQLSKQYKLASPHKADGELGGGAPFLCVGPQRAPPHKQPSSLSARPSLPCSFRGGPLRSRTKSRAGREGQWLRPAAARPRCA